MTLPAAGSFGPDVQEALPGEDLDSAIDAATEGLGIDWSETILVSRHEGGLGDQLCCEVAVRALRERHPDRSIIWAVGSVFSVLWAGYEHAQVISPGPFDDIVKLMAKRSAVHFELDGPEFRYAQRVAYDLKLSRIENWCDYVECRPQRMRPLWKPRDGELAQVAAHLRQAELSIGEFILVQWATADPMKDWPRMDEFCQLLYDLGMPFMITHHAPIPDLDSPSTQRNIRTWVAPTHRQLGCLTRLAGLVVGPDSALMHFAAAVDTPFLGVFGPTSPEVYCKHYPLAEWVWDKQACVGKPCERTFPCWGIQSRNWWCVSREHPVAWRSIPLKRSPWCMDGIDPEDVIEKAFEMLDKHEEWNQQKIDPEASWYAHRKIDSEAIDALTRSTPTLEMRQAAPVARRVT